MTGKTSRSSLFAPHSSTQKIRIDHLLVEQGLVPSRERAQATIMAGKVLVGEKLVRKASERFPRGVLIRLKGKDHPYVSRGGVKLAGALKDFRMDPTDKVCLDVGASTGGFTDCLLQRGARKVYTLDAGSNQLDWKLRRDPRVVARENFNARYLKPREIPEPVDLVTVDVSFISVKKILPALLQGVEGSWDLLLLIKPQFEVGRIQVGKGGVVRDPRARLKVAREIKVYVRDCGLKPEQLKPSVLAGESGNQEYFLYAHHKIPPLSAKGGSASGGKIRGGQGGVMKTPKTKN